jgi:hypothetical protein
MQVKAMIQGLALLWLLLFVVSFVALQFTAAGDGAAGGLNRIAAFLTWQGIALVVAAVGAFAARYAAGRGVANVKLLGYGPLAVSVFLVGSFVAIMAYRVFAAPLLGGA